MEPAWIWLIVGIVLAIAEIVVPGVFLIWIGSAALVTGAVMLALPLGAPAQLGIFAMSVCVALLGGRHVMLRAPIISDDPLLNERTARLIGKKVVVIDSLVGGEGRVRVGDGVWPAAGPDAAAGTLVEVVGADGARLIVEPVPS